MKVLALRIGEVLALPSMKFENSSDSATKSCCSTPLSQGTAAFSQNVPRDFKIMNDNALVTTFYLKHAVLVSCKKKLGVGVPQAKIKCGRISGDQKSQSLQFVAASFK